MKTPANFKGHPFHPMLIAFPIGLWTFAFLCAITFLASKRGTWDTVAVYSMAAGCIGALVAAAPGFVDWLAIPYTRAKILGMWHMIVNVGALCLFAIAFFLRIGGHDWYPIPLVLSVVAMGLLLVGGWLGGSIVYIHGIAVEPAPRPTEPPPSSINP